MSTTIIAPSDKQVAYRAELLRTVAARIMPQRWGDHEALGAVATARLSPEPTTVREMSDQIGRLKLGRNQIRAHALKSESGLALYRAARAYAKTHEFAYLTDDGAWNTPEAWSAYVDGFIATLREEGR